MGKSSKKKKQDSDFVKPKLKVGKKKPNATNFTNTKFKSSAINVQAQLEEKSEPTNRRNLSLKDILHQINHYNDNTRQDATESLRSFFVQYPSSLHQNLNIFLPKLLSKSVDAHFNVRKHFILCLEHVFQNVTSSEIQPFFSVIMAHLSCAMTHINEEIQADSLKFMDLCLDLFPALFLESCEKVFPNFLGMVYQSQGPSVGKKELSKISITKIINQSVLIQPIGKMSNAKTRKDILEKLLKIVSLVFLPNSRHSNPNKVRTHVDFLVSKSSDRFSLFKYKCREHQCGNFSNDFHGDERELVVSDKIKSIRSAIMSFVPVLFECWNDCRGSDATRSNIGNDSTLQIMTSIISILRGITSSQVENKEIASFTDTHIDDFRHFFLEEFPFSFSIACRKATKHKQMETKVDEVVINSSICDVYCKMISSNQSIADLRQLEKIIGYIKSLSYSGIMSKMADCVDSIRETVCILVELVMKWNNSRAQDKLSKPLHDILGNLTLIYKESKGSAAKLQLLPVLEYLLQLMDSLESSSQTNFVTQISEAWINLLPRDLKSCNPENSDFLLRVMAVISTILTRRQMLSDMRSELDCAINHVIGAPKSIFTISTCDMSVQRKFLEIIYHLPQVSKDLVKSLSFLCHRKETSTEIKSYVCHILYYCLLKTSVDLGLFLSFVLSVVVGFSWTNLENIQSSKEQNQLSDTKSLTFMISCNPKSKRDETQVIAEHVKLCEVVADLVQAFECKGNTLEMLLPTMDQLLTSFRILPDSTVVGLLTLLHRLRHFFCQLREDNCKPICYKLAELMFSVVVYRCFGESNRVEDSLWSKIAFGITCKLLCENDIFLDGWITSAITAIGSIDDVIIARSLRSLKGQPVLHSKLEHIFANQTRTTRLKLICNKYVNDLSI